MAAATPVSAEQSARRAEILAAATGVFVRYGFKKTSMDDVARAAGLSRQGLYLHFPNKTDLFRGVVSHFVELARIERRRVLSEKGVDLETRLLDAFVVSHGTEVGSENLQELVASTVQLVGDVLRESEQQLVADVTRALREESVAAQWKHVGIAAADLADLLSAASAGIKHDAKSPAEYRRRMSVAVRLICRGTPRRN
jgi:AcrR family transcriptional regulator